MKIKQNGTVKGGKFIPEDAERFRRSFYGHEGKRVTVTVERYSKKRTTPQYSYLHGVPYSIISDWSGHTVDEVADAMKAMFLVPREICGVAVSGTTTKLDTVQFEEYTAQIRAWGAQQGVYIPLPNEAEYE